MKLRVLTEASPKLFTAGLILTAALMPLDRLQDLATAFPYAATIAFLLMIQYPAVVLLTRRRVRLSPIIALAMGLPLVSAAVTSASAYSQALAWSTTALLVFVVVRGWLAAQFISRGQLEIFERAVLIVAALVAVFGCYQYVGDVYGLSNAWTGLLASYSSTATYPFPRVQSVALEPLYLAHYLLLPIGLMLVRALRRQWRVHWLERLNLVLVLTVFLLTLSRGAILGLVMSLVVLLIGARSWRLLWYIARYGLAAIVLTTGFVAWAGSVQKQSTVGIFAGHAVDLNDESARTRYDLWPQAWEIFRAYPLDGVGPYNSRLLVHDKEPTADATAVAKLQPLNNDYLAYVAEQGVVGILLVLPLAALVLMALWAVWQQRFVHPAGPYAFAMIGMAFEANAFHSILLLRTWIVIGLLVAGWRLFRERSKA
ncbi:O-antigen ligase family protein [bacterium]|nr:MAG: O-antigen ligase family protein [bacterium]